MFCEPQLVECPLLGRQDPAQGTTCKEFHQHSPVRRKLVRFPDTAIVKMKIKCMSQPGNC